MTSVEPMTPRELLELASLDALALLDTVEEAIYTRSFHDAPATVQDEVLRLQAEIADDLSLLPGDEPDPQLRERVLKAVAEAIERNDSTLAPLARIGRLRSTSGHDTGTRFGVGGTGQFWRAATFVLAGVSLIMAYFMAMGRQASDDVTAAALWGNASALDLLLTPPAKQWLLDDSTKIALQRVDANDPYRGSLYVNKATRKALILLENFPASDGKDYVLQVVMENGGPAKRLQTFRTNAGFGGVQVNVPANLIAGIVTWQIAEAATGVVLLASI